MPGLRFKKRAARRHTIDNLEQNAKDIEAAKVEQAQKKKENEKFMQLFKSKYPNHAKDVNLHVDDVKDGSNHANGHVTSGDGRDKTVSPLGRVLCSPVRRSNSLSSKNNDHLFLRYHGEMRRTAMPKILTMAGLKKLFIEAFNLDRSVTHWPDGVLYIQDRYTDQWSELQDPGQAVESGILLLRDLNHSSLPLLSNTGVDTDSTDVSTTQSPVTHHGSRGNLTKKPHKYESIDDFSKPDRGHSSSSVSRDPTPPMAYRQPSSMGLRKISASSAMAEQRINELSTHIVSGGRHLTNSMHSIASAGGGSPDQLVKSVNQTYRSVCQVKSDFQVLRALHSRQLQTFEHFMKYSCSQIMSHIRKANLNDVNPSSSLRMKRLEVDPQEEAYRSQAQETFNEFRLLEAALDEITVDVTQRQCRVNGAEVEKLAAAVASSARALIELQHRYLPLEDALKDVMERELEVIIMEEKMIKEEGHNLEDAIIKCKDMTETLLSLRKLAASDLNRSLIVPMIQAVSEPDKDALMENIQAITPNHEARMQSIAVAEETYRKKKQVLVVDAVKVIGRDLRNSKLQLRSVIPIEELERRRQHKLRQLYLEEKSDKEQYQTVKQQQQITNKDVARMALARRKELERLRDEEQRKEEKRLEEQKAEMCRAEVRRAEERRAEQRRAEERRAEQRRAEQRREEQRRAERRAEEQRAELRKAEERREEQRRAERRVEEQMAERRRVEERREDLRRAEQRRIEEQMVEQRRVEERRIEQRRIEEQRAEQRRVEERRAEQRRIEEQRAEQRREEERRIEQRRLEEQRAEEQRKLELEEANKAEQRKDHQQLLAAEELLRRVTGETSTTVKFGAVKRQSVLLDDQQNKTVPSNHWYNSTSSGVPLRDSTLVQSSEQWRRSASGGRPKSMEVLDFSTPKHTPLHHREGPIGGYPSPPRHKAPPPPVPKSANQARHQSRLNATDKQHNRAHTLGYHTAAVVHPVPSQTHHNQLDNGFRDQHFPGWNKKLNNYPSNLPPKRREPYKTTYTTTEHGPTLYSMV